MLRLLADSAEQGDLSPRAIGELARMIGAIIAEGEHEAAVGFLKKFGVEIKSGARSEQFFHIAKSEHEMAHG